MIERTLSIIKPDAVAHGHAGAILSMFEQAGIAIKACKMVHLSRQQAEAFYAVHRQRPFFADLVQFMTSGPIMVSVLQGTDVIAHNRRIMGPTDPSKAPPESIRKKFGTDIQRNAVHGSDAADTARTEIAHFFSEFDILP